MITTTKLSGQTFWPKPPSFDLYPDLNYGPNSRRSRTTNQRTKSPNPEVHFPALNFNIPPVEKDINLDRNPTLFQDGSNSKSEYYLLNFSGHWVMPWLITEIQS